MLIQCRSCSSKKLTDILSLGDIHLSGFTKDDRKPPKYPLSLVLCKNCYLLQLSESPPQSLLYTENYGYKSGINQTMQKELETIVKKALKKIYAPRKDMLVVDIGANDGTLLKNYPKSIETVGVEPIKKLAKECKQHASIVINDFFNYKAYKKAIGDRKAIVVTVISCFYDMEEPNIFISDLANILAEDGICVIQQNYLVSMLKQNAFDNIVHEHLEYYSLLSLQNLLERYNLEVFDVELTDLNGGSFRTYIAFKNKRRISKKVSTLLAAEKQLGLNKEKVYREFAKRIQKNKKLLLDFILKKVKTGKRIYIYGASTRGNTLLQYYNIDSNITPYAIERNPEKWGTKIASVGIPIISEEQARKEKPDYMLVLPWFFKKEFLKREKMYLRNGGHFIFPLPKLEII